MMNLEGCHTILFGVMSTLLVILTKYSREIETDHIKKIISIASTLIKRAGNQTELFKLISIQVFDLLAVCLESLPYRLLLDRKIEGVSQTIASDYLNFYVNKHVLAYFDREKAPELERASLFSYADTFAAISANTKLSNADIIPITTSPSISSSKSASDLSASPQTNPNLASQADDEDESSIFYLQSIQYIYKINFHIIFI